MSRWFRHYAGMMRDDKLVRVAIRTKQPVERVLWVFGAILESAAEVDDNGRYDFDAAEVAYFLRADEADIGAIETGLTDAGHLAAGCVVKWGDRQFTSDRSKDRVAAHRERKRAEVRGNRVTETEQNTDVTLQQRHCIAPETETETETEKDISTEANASSEIAPARKKSDFPKPEWADPGVWKDFLANRKSKRLPNTATAYQGFLDDIARIATPEWPPPALLRHAAIKGWGGIYLPDEGSGNGRSSQNRSSGAAIAPDAWTATLRDVASREPGIRAVSG